MGKYAAVAIALVLAACQVAPGPGGAPTIGEPGPRPGLYREARETCRTAGRREGFEVLRFFGSREVRSGDGRLAGIDLDMRVRRRGRVNDLLCEYDTRRGIAYLTGVAERPGERSARMRRAREACGDAARRAGYEVRRLTAERRVTSGRGQVVAVEFGMRVSRRARGEEVLCTYRFETGRARITGDGRLQDEPGHARALAEARRACRREAEARGFEVRRVLTTERRTGAGGAGSAEIVLEVRRGGQTYPVRCVYDLRQGVARI